MKCIHCQSDTKYPDRAKNGGRCEKCKHRFAFEPKTDNVGGVAISDGLFERVIKDVSADGKVFFTEKQLWYEFNRRLHKKFNTLNGWVALAGISGVGGFALTLATASVIPLALGAAGLVWGVTGFFRERKNGPAPRYDRIAFGAFTDPVGTTGYLHRWISAHGPIEKLLPPYDPAKAAPASDPPPDVTAFSFDRALVTQHAEVAAMLVANNLHFETNCAVLSLDGYPGPRTATILEMLRRNPNLTVFALHDASPEGLLLPGELRKDTTFPEATVRIVELGLLPRHAIQGKMILTKRPPATVDGSLHPALRPDEIEWLRKGAVAELETMRPDRMMRAIAQGFSRAGLAGDDGPDGGFIWIGDPGYGYAGGYSTADSFG